MIKLSILAVSALISSTASALTFSPDTINIDSISTRLIEHADIHVRQHCEDWQVVWDYTDADNFTRASVRAERTTPEDVDFGLSSIVTIERVIDGIASEIVRQKVRHSDYDFSIKLTADRFGVRLYVGDGQQLDTEGLGTTLAQESKIFLVDKSKAESQRITHSVTYVPDAQTSRFSTVAELDSYLKTSKDINECYWQYLDRDIDTQRASLGGLYRLATVRSGDGYDLIYVDGARVFADRWKALDVKGHLSNTIFINSYDLMWLDSSRHSRSTDISATITDSSILTLFFPLLKSQIRFSRVPR